MLIAFRSTDCLSTVHPCVAQWVLYSISAGHHIRARHRQTNNCDAGPTPVVPTPLKLLKRPPLRADNADGPSASRTDTKRVLFRFPMTFEHWHVSLFDHS